MSFVSLAFRLHIQDSKLPERNRIMKIFIPSKPFISLICITALCVLLIQCSGSESSSSNSESSEDISSDASCSDVPALKKVLTAKMLAATTGDDSNVEIVVCTTEDDDDGDTITDSEDNCNQVWNFSQTDTDEDGFGDSCDNCESVANSSQADTDQDGTGDDCDEDTDNDSIVDDEDNCEFVYNPEQTDTDKDDTGDMCDGSPDDPEITNDSDGDGIDDADDNCPNAMNAYLNSDGSYTYITDYQWDMDDDGLGDACDDDIDNDTRSNDIDDCDYNIRSDCGGTDTDGDGVPDSEDNCDSNANPGQEDIDDDGIGSACDSDESSASEEAVADETDNTETGASENSDETTPTATTEVCNDGEDNDLDGLEDCDDTSCKEESYCDYDGDGTKNSADDDKDGDGLPNDLDLCELDTDDWYLVPIHWLEDNNGTADEAPYFAECFDTNAITYTGSAVCDLVENLSVVRLFVDYDYAFVEHNFQSNNELTEEQRLKAKNANSTFVYGNNDVTLGFADGESYFLIDTADMIGTFQKDRDADGVGDACDTGLVVKNTNTFNPNIFTSPRTFTRP